jgi:hypothetical protein
MSSAALSRGGATVGSLSGLPALEAEAVLCLRHWFSGPEARRRMQAQLTANLGTAGAEDALKHFGQLCQLCLSHGRRPLVRHGLHCDCLGADENVFANLIASAAEGERADAMMMASLIVAPQMAPGLMSAATEFGQALKQATAHQMPLQQRPAGSITLH